MSRHHATCGRRGGWAFSETPKLPHSYMLGQQGIRTGQIMSYRIESPIVVWQGWLLEQPQCYGPVHRSCQCGSVVRAQLNMLCHDANVADKPVLLSIEILVMQRRGKKRAGKYLGHICGCALHLRIFDTWAVYQVVGIVKQDTSVFPVVRNIARCHEDR